MKNQVRQRFYPEVGAGVVTAVLFLVTLVRRDWLEPLFGLDPDSGSGSVEWLIVGGLLVTTMALVLLARYEWRRASAVMRA